MSGLISDITAIALDSGFQAARTISVSGLLRAIGDRLRPEPAAKAREALSLYFGTVPLASPDAHSILVCGLSCFERESGEEEREPYELGLVASFARKNYYEDAVVRLKGAFRRLRGTAYAGKDLHVFSNSRIPEKLIAWASGIGWYGKNSLIINEKLGSRFVISGMLLHTATETVPVRPDPMGAGCGECTRCMEACPVRAIVDPGIIDRNLCMQSLASRPADIPEETLQAWGRMIYGCDICQNACPHNRALSLTTATDRGAIGAGLPLARLLAMTRDEIRAFFRKSALDRGWIDPLALRRNALIASGNSGNPALIAAVEPFGRDPDPRISKIAEWAIARLSRIPIDNRP